MIHNRHQVQVDSGDRVAGRTHSEGSRHDPCAAGIFSLQIEIVRLYIQSKRANPQRQQRQETVGLRHSLRQRQMQKHRPQRRAESRRRLQLGRLFSCGGKRSV